MFRFEGCKLSRSALSSQTEITKGKIIENFHAECLILGTLAVCFVDQGLIHLLLFDSNNIFP